jgi:hypothetical protein
MGVSISQFRISDLGKIGNFHAEASEKMVLSAAIDKVKEL